MKAKHQQLLLHPFFLFSLVLLLLNDLYLKPVFHNWLTGKLSDFAGLFAFSLFLSAFFYQYRKLLIPIIALCFTWWKSPASTAAISFLNNDLHIPIHRVIDYSDCIALLIVPVIYYIRPVYYAASFRRQVAIVCIGMISAVSFMADSLPRKLIDANKVMLKKNIKTRKSEGQIISALQTGGMNVKADSAIYEREMYRTYYLKSRDSSGNEIMIPAEPRYGGVYIKPDYGDVYIVPLVVVGVDSIYNLRFAISDYSSRSNLVFLHSFEYKPVFPGAYSESYFIWKRVKKPLKKKFKALLK